MVKISEQSRRITRRGLLKYTGAGAAGVTLAGCKTPSDDGQDDGTTVTGSPGSTGPLSGQTVRIGALAPQPESFPLGQSLANSAKMAAEKLNADGLAGTDTNWKGIAGADVEIKVGNTENSPGIARDEFRRLVREENVHATTGIFLTQTLLQIFQPMKNTKTIHLTTGAAGPKPARVVHDRYDEFKYHFRPGPINSFDLAKAELEFLTLYADKLGWDSIAVLTESIAPFDPFQEALKGGIAGFDGISKIVEEVPVFKRTSSGISNWAPIWDEVEQSGADLALIAQALSGTSSIKQWYNQQRSFELGGIHVPDQIYEFWGEVDGACRYTFTMNAITPQTTNTPRTQPFMKRYNKKYDTYPVYVGPITYDGVRIYAKAMENAVREEGLSEIPDSDTMVTYLENVTFEKGTVIPQFQFTPRDAKFAHDPQWNSMKESGVPVWQQWQKDPEISKDYGVMHSFAPEANQTAEYSFPHWIDYPDDHPANTDGFGKQPGENP